jgi:aminoglycoside phosphotransferase (APT) family kinase protein
MVGSLSVSETDDFDSGWDNRVTLVDGHWVHRTPRYPDREPQLRREAELLPWLAPQLPLPVPVPEVVSESPFTVRHAYLPGGPCPGTSASHGTVIGEFLRALHAVDDEEAVRHGARESAACHADTCKALRRMEHDVLPLLPGRVVQAGLALLERMAAPPPLNCVVHGDLGPAHIRVVGEQVGGVIDWGDCGVGDPALDLAWTTLGSAPAFSGAVVAGYGPDDELVARARDWHMLGPWHEVLYGLGGGGPGFVESGLAGTVARLESRRV